jgi:actin-related protein
MKGIVVESGDGVKNVINVDDGYVIGSWIKNIKIDGRKINYLIK